MGVCEPVRWGKAWARPRETMSVSGGRCGRGHGKRCQSVDTLAKFTEDPLWGRAASRRGDTFRCALSRHDPRILRHSL